MSLVDILLLISLLLPLIAVLTILLIKDNKIEAANNARVIALLASILNFLFSIYLYFSIHYKGYQFIINYNIFKQVFINFAIGIDGLSLLFLLLSNFLFIIVFLFINTNKYTKNTFALLLLLEFAIISTFLAFNLWIFYIFFELSVFLVFFLMKNTKQLAYAQYKFLILNGLASLFMFIGIVYIIYTTKQAGFVSLFSMNLPVIEQKYLWWIFFLAFAMKSGIFPFHIWVKDIYANSNNIINMILSSILIKFGIYGFLRIVIPAFPVANLTYYPIAIILSLITAFYAMFLAFSSNNIKSFIGYFSLSHIGIIILGIFSLKATGISGAIFQAASHSIFMIGFILVFIFIENKVEAKEFSSVSGLIKVMPYLAFFYMVISLAGLSMPGTNAFVGEFLILQGLFDRMAEAAVFATFTIVFSAVVVLVIYKKLMYGASSYNLLKINDINLVEKIALFVIVILIIGTGVYPQGILSLINPYVNQVIGFIKSQEVIFGFF